MHALLLWQGHFQNQALSSFGEGIPCPALSAHRCLPYPYKFVCFLQSLLQTLLNISRIFQCHWVCPAVWVKHYYAKKDFSFSVEMKEQLIYLGRHYALLILRHYQLVFATFLLLILSVCITLAQPKLPATHLFFNDDTSKLQFAIISDLWGGYRSGVLEDAVEKLEMLQPQFVMSVGDLIDGKTRDLKVLDEQWSEFNIHVNSLSMPFFYVPGNHDISNPWMEREWKRRLGRSYYYFIYSNVLFLCINTQDGGSSAINAEQVNYFKKAIEENPEVRWTFVFMHRPVWRSEEGSEVSYEKIEAELIGKNYTLFSGHSHTYLKRKKHGKNHYALSVTGGGSDLRGEKHGQFDHITWVTFKTGEAPKIINLKLDGMLRDDVRK